MKSMVPYEKQYDDSFTYIEFLVGVPQDLSSILKKKREFGKKKYGENSFQISEENTLRIDTVQHAQEEMVDYINYLIHTLIQISLDKKDVPEEQYLRTNLSMALQMYRDLHSYSNGDIP